MQTLQRAKGISFVIAITMLVTFLWTGTTVYGTGTQDSQKQDTNSQNGKMTYIGNYSTGISNKDGGVAEIVKYNKENETMYLVNGAEQSVDIVSVSALVSRTKTELKRTARLDMKVIAQANGFDCGDITSVDVNTEKDIIAMAVQGADYNSKGSIVIMDYAGNYKGRFECGYQPDMVTFTPDGNYVMTADEGEPREGYEAGTEDPQGSITLVNISGGLNAQPQSITFESFDAQRAELVADGVLLKPNTDPSKDLEPEYIAVSKNSKKAYVSLQEANAIATLDIENGIIIDIKGLGAKDFSKEGNELDVLEDGKAELSTQNLQGVYMPDGCDTATINGKEYVLTANEGDSRDWGSKPNKYTDEKDAKINSGGTDYEITAINADEKDGLNGANTYLYGARSFSIWDAKDMSQVYDSGSDFEKITAKIYPTYFNSSNNKTKLDSRSGKKGPEPESVITLKAGDKTYAFTGLERIGGVMMYDISDPANASYTDYINLRNFNGTSVSDSGSLAPEGLCAIEASDSPTGYPLVLAANEVSGNIDVLQVEEGHTAKSIEGAVVDKITAAIYTGKAIEPKVTVKMGTKTLKQGTDYTVAYENNVNTGTAKAVITGTGLYSGEKTVTFTIGKASQKIDVSNVTKTYGSKSFKLNAKTSGNGTLTYQTGNKKVATISKNGTVTLKSPGKTTIRVTAAAAANYQSAVKTVTVTVKPKAVAISKVKSYRSKRLKITWKKSSKATGYQVVVAKNKSFKKGKKIAYVKGTSKTFKKLAKSTKYYVKVRPYKSTGSGKVYGSYSKVKIGKVR